MYLRCAVNEAPKQWKSWLALAELWYNSNYHTSLGCSLFKALYGYDPELGTMLPTPDLPQSSASEFLLTRETQLAILKDHLATAQNRMKLQADRHRSDRQFCVGEKVLLKLQPYVQQSVVSRPYPKLSFKFFGPFEVLEKIGSAAYRLALPDHSLLHPVFHVSQLKPFTPNYSPVYSDLPKLVDLSVHDLQPERILDRRLVKKGNQVESSAGSISYMGRSLCCQRAFSRRCCLGTSNFFGRGRCNAHGGSGNLHYAIECVIGICFTLPVLSSVMGPGCQCPDSRI